jgi:hypothetical protein
MRNRVGSTRRVVRTGVVAAAVALVLCGAGAGSASAQGALRPCTYDTCALRVQAPTLTGPRMLVRGAQGTEVVRLGLLEPAIAPFVTLSDSAVAHAHLYDTLYDRGSILNIAGTVIAIASPILLRGAMQKIAFTGAGIGLTVYGGVLVNQANDALSRSLWWYNRELAR